MNKYYIKSQNNLTSIVKFSIAEMNKNIYDLSIKVDELENENLILREKIDNLEERNKYLKYDNKCLNEEIERRNKGD